MTEGWDLGRLVASERWDVSEKEVDQGVLEWAIVVLAIRLGTRADHRNLGRLGRRFRSTARYSSAFHRRRFRRSSRMPSAAELGQAGRSLRRTSRK